MFREIWFNKITKTNLAVPSKVVTFQDGSTRNINSSVIAFGNKDGDYILNADIYGHLYLTSKNVFYRVRLYKETRSKPIAYVSIKNHKMQKLIWEK